VLIQFSTKTITVLYAGQAEEKEAFMYKVKVMQRHGVAELFQYAGINVLL
jgi:hypothetical protein